jgi:hypothetical protein
LYNFPDKEKYRHPLAPETKVWYNNVIKPQDSVSAVQSLGRKARALAVSTICAMKRTAAYIDGYNLYYGLLKGTPYKTWGQAPR